MKLQVYFCLKRRKCMRLIGNKPLIYMTSEELSRSKATASPKKNYEGKFDTCDKNLPTYNQFCHSRDRRHDIECKKETRSQ